MVNDYLRHSAEGSSWKKHKYIKRKNGTYYYPPTYKGGKYTDPAMKEDGSVEESKLEKGEESENEESFTLSDEEINALAMEVVRGNFGNGQERKELMGEHYQEVQDRVNKILKGGAGASAISESSEGSKEKVDSALKKLTVSKDEAKNREETARIKREAVVVNKPSTNSNKVSNDGQENAKETAKKKEEYARVYKNGAAKPFKTYKKK